MIEDYGVATAGTAESFLHATHVTKTINAFQITACALCKLLKSAFDNEQLYSGVMDLCFEDSSSFHLLVQQAFPVQFHCLENVEIMKCLFHEMMSLKKLLLDCDQHCRQPLS